MPAGVHRFDHPQLPQPVPFLDLAFAFEGRLAGLVPFVPDQSGDAVSGGEAVGPELVPVLTDPRDQVVSRAGVQRPVSLAGDDIGLEGHEPRRG